MDVTDSELIERFRQGERNAFEQIVLRWDTRVLNLAYRLSSDPEEAREIRQMAFLRAHGGLGTFNGRARFSTWLHQVVLNIWRDRVRRRARRRRAMESAPQVRAARTSVLPCPAEASQKKEASTIVADAVAALPEAEREVVVLRHYEGLTFAEIGELLEAPASTVKARMHRGMCRLRERLKDLDL